MVATSPAHYAPSPRPAAIASPIAFSACHLHLRGAATMAFSSRLLPLSSDHVRRRLTGSIKVCHGTSPLNCLIVFTSMVPRTGMASHAHYALQIPRSVRHPSAHHHWSATPAASRRRRARRRRLIVQRNRSPRRFSTAIGCSSFIATVTTAPLFHPLRQTPVARLYCNSAAQIASALSTPARCPVPDSSDYR